MSEYRDPYHSFVWYADMLYIKPFWHKLVTMYTEWGALRIIECEIAHPKFEHIRHLLPIAITVNKTVVYCRNTSPDLLAKLLKS